MNLKEDESDPRVVKLYQELQKMKRSSPEYEEMIKKIRVITDSILGKSMKRRKDYK
jgi:hypothetical protein